MKENLSFVVELIDDVCKWRKGEILEKLDWNLNGDGLTNRAWKPVVVMGGFFRLVV